MHTVILHHGLLGGGMGVGPFQWRSFKDVERAMVAQGFRVGVTAVHPTAGVATRALQLKKWIEAHAGLQKNERAILIAHSMGGLDARYMLSRLGMAERVKALITISTPHHGSTFADWWVAHIGRRLGMIRLAEQMGLDLQSAQDVMVASCAAFNREILDVPDVRYYSVTAWSAWTQVPFFAVLSHRLVEKAEGPNDGLVSMQSARWGTHLATWQANHWESCGRRLPSGSHQMDVPTAYLDVLNAAAVDRQ